MPLAVQELIHRYEVGAGSRILKLIAGLLAIVGLAIFYDLNAFRNLTTAEGLDAAQLARNIADGKGYSTDFIRPFSIYLLKQREQDRQGNAEPTANVSARTNQAAAITTAKSVNWPAAERHPDLANPPLYPLLLAGMLKVMPFEFPNLLTAKSFSIYSPDLWVTALNQLLIVLAACLVFRIARKLFDEPVAWVSAAVFAGTELFWRFSVSGLSTPLLMFLFLALVDVLTSLDHTVRDQENPPNQGRLVVLACAAGVLLALGGLTRYAFCWLSVPVILWLAFLPTQKRSILTLATVAAFLLLMTPWVVRNYNLTGTPFGTATYAAMQGTSGFPEDQLERSLHPDFRQLGTSDYSRKFWTNTRDMIQNDLPKFGGNWVSALFLVGLLMPFRNPTIGRMRILLVLCMGTLFVAQALGRTAWSTDSPEINSDNLLVVLAPCAFVFGVSLLFALLESTAPAMRSIILTVFFCLACGPLILNFFSNHDLLYYPPWIQHKASQLKPEQAMLSDIPWAVAWYGHRQSVWLPLKHRAAARERIKEDFYALQDAFKPVSGLYLTSKSLKSIEIRSVAQWPQVEVQDADWDKFSALVVGLAESVKAGQTNSTEDMKRLQSLIRVVEKHWVRGDDESWASFLLGIYINREVPTGFPLRRAPLGLVPEIFLTDSERKPEKAIQSSE